MSLKPEETYYPCYPHKVLIADMRKLLNQDTKA